MQAEHRIHPRPQPHLVLALVDRALGQREAEPRHLPDLPGQLERGRLQVRARHDPAHHAHLVSPFGAEPPPGEQHLLGEPRPEHPRVREVLHARNPHLHHRVGEERVVGRHDQVAHPGEHQPAGDAGALHHRDGRLGDLPPAPAHAQVDLHLPGVPGVRAPFAHVVPPQHGLAVEGFVRVPLRGADVMPGAEVLARPGQDQHRDLVVVHRPGERRVQRVGHRGVLRVGVLRPVQRDQGDPPALLVQHLVRHQDPPLRMRLSTLPDGLRGSASRNSTCRGTL